MIGQTLSHFKITAKLGEGGMGEVYRAEDTKLGREVAIKVLPEAFVRDQERLARFEREAKVLASLNHSNIAAIYEIGHADGVHFLAMELAEGEDLAQRLNRGALSPENALPIARQIARALEAAHGQGIVHRDLKPANVMIRTDGTVKILDFGLAKAQTEADPSEDMTQSPTLTAQMTAAGVLLGTAAYMSPEQARGLEVDKQTDIWAFGCVLYDMLAGTRPFGGNTVTDTLAAILEREPDWDALPATTQPSLLKLLRRCLHKDVSSRLHDVADARIEIEDLLAGDGETLGRLESDQGPAHLSLRASQRIAWAVAAVAVVVAAWVLWSSQVGAPASRTAPIPSVSRTIIPTEPLLTDGRVPALAISTDGRRVAYSSSGATGQIYVRDIDSLEALSLDGTEGAFGPFFSPDGERIGFATDGWLSTVSTSGGPANPLQQIRVFLGGDWSEESGIVYGEWPTRHLWRIDATGGAATALTDPMADIRYYIDVAPSFVGGGEAVVFNNFNAFTSPGEPVVRAQGVDRGKQRVLDLAGSHVHYVPTGHLVFAKGGSLFAAPFDADELELVGPPVGVLAGVLTSVYGAAHYDVSNTGTLIYLPGTVQRSEHRLVWVDRSGKSSPITDESRGFWGPRLSPDGTRIAVWIADERPHVWIYDLLRGGLTPLTTEGSNFWSVWTPDGTGIAFASRQEDGTGYIARQVADRGSPAEAIVGEEISIVEQPLSWAEGGEALIFQRGSEKEGGFDLWSASLADASEHRALVSTKANEYQGVLSPDGRWLAHVSDESGRPEIYVRPYPAVDRTIPISTQGGEEPLWAPSGRELFYRSEGRMMVVDIETGQSFSPSRPRVLFEDRFIRGTPYGRNYDIDRSGQRFLMSESATGAQQATQIVVVQNWFEELKRLVPVEQRQE